MIPAVAGLALISTLVASLRAALAEAAEQLPAGVTLLVTASGISAAGISAAFWALLAGLALLALLVRRRRRQRATAQARDGRVVTAGSSQRARHSG